MNAPQIGILGGSFDPPHIGHLMLALVGLSLGRLTRVIVAPTYIHAFGKPLQPFEHRMRMCELAFQDIAHVEVSPIERELGGESRTLRLLHALKLREPDAQLRLLIGSDILAERDRWQDFEAVSALAPLMVAGRLGQQEGEATLGAVLPDVSSTELRLALSKGASTPLLPWRVCDYIREHRLYEPGA